MPTLYAHPLRLLCRRLLLRCLKEKRAALAERPLKPGETARAVALRPAEVTRLIRTAALNAGAPSEDNRRHDRVIWREQDSELLVYLSRVVGRTQPGTLLIDVPVHCDQVGDATIRMAFALGDEQRPAGMIAATETKPRGPAAIVDVWGDALIAFGWQLLLKTAESIAAETGKDDEDSPLVAVALTVSAAGMSVLPMARHAFTRKLDPLAQRPKPILKPRLPIYRGRP